MNIHLKQKPIYISTHTVKAANRRLIFKEAGQCVHDLGRFLTRDEIKAAFKAASQKLKSA